jgi:hypothetical protein
VLIQRATPQLVTDWTGEPGSTRALVAALDPDPPNPWTDPARPLASRVLTWSSDRNASLAVQDAAAQLAVELLLPEAGDRPHPEHSARSGRSPHPLGHFLERQPLEVAEEEDVAVILGEAFEGRGDAQLLLPAEDMLARGRFRGCRIVRPGPRSIVIAVEGNLAAGIALRGAPPALRLVVGVVDHDPLQPGEPLAGRLAGKAVEAAVGLEERLLDDIGGIDLRL